MLRQRQFTESQVNSMGDPQMDFDFGTEDTSAKIERRTRAPWQWRMSVSTLMKLVLAWACAYSGADAARTRDMGSPLLKLGSEKSKTTSAEVVNRSLARPPAYVFPSSC
jgi:hypothetical protein